MEREQKGKENTRVKRCILPCFFAFYLLLFCMNQTDLGLFWPVLDCICPNQKSGKKKKKTDSPRTCVQPRQRPHGTSVQVGRGCGTPGAAPVLPKNDSGLLAILYQQ